MRPHLEAVGGELLQVGRRQGQGAVEAPPSIVLERTAVQDVGDRHEEAGRNAEVAQVLDGPHVVAIPVVEGNGDGDLVALVAAEASGDLREGEDGVVAAEEVHLPHELLQGQAHVVQRPVGDQVIKEDADRRASLALQPLAPPQQEGRNQGVLQQDAGPDQAGRARAQGGHAPGRLLAQLPLELPDPELARRPVRATLPWILRRSLPPTAGDGADGVVVELGPRQIRLDAEARERIALFYGDGRLGDHVPLVDLRGGVVDGDADRALAGQHLPVADGPASAVVRHLAFVDVQRAVLWDRYHRVAQYSASYDDAELGAQRTEKSQALLAVDVGDAVDGNARVAGQRVVGVDADGTVRPFEEREGGPVGRRRREGQGLEPQPTPPVLLHPATEPPPERLPGACVAVDDDGAQLEQRVTGQPLEEDAVRRRERSRREHHQPQPRAHPALRTTAVPAEYTSAHAARTADQECRSASRRARWAIWSARCG